MDMTDKPEPTRDHALDIVADWVNHTEDRVKILETEVEVLAQRKREEDKRD